MQNADAECRIKPEISIQQFFTSSLRPSRLCDEQTLAIFLRRADVV